MDDDELAVDHLRRALDGDAESWNALVDAYSGLIWSVVRSFRMDRSSQEDAFQATWLRLLDRGESIREPGRLPSWLVTVARRECIALLRSSSRVVPATESLDTLLPPSELSSNLEQVEVDGAIRQLFDQLDDACRLLLSMLISDPPVSYATISGALGMPVGSIGPTRGRCLDKLRKSLAAAGIFERGTPSGQAEERS